VRLFAGLDGGQSSTQAVIGDERGRILAGGSGAAADEIGVNADSTRLHDALSGALDDARRRAGLPDDTRFDAIVAGISGYDGRVYGRAPRLPSARVLLMHDTPIAHAGALGASAGVIAIAGTGSVVYGRAEDGSTQTLGGWGFLFGDEGSASRIARDALASVMRAYDENDPSLDRERDALFDFFGKSSLRQIAHAFYKGEITRAQLAAFAPVALRFDAFRAIANHGADRIAALIARAIDAGAPPRVALVGGVFADEGFRERVCAGVRAAAPRAEIVQACYEPAWGALLLAYRELGLGVTELHS
jgi:N-acetylglucosamine kinase-like BadF-type ATPase